MAKPKKINNTITLNNQIFQDIGMVYNKYSTKALYDTSQLKELANSTANPLSNNKTVLEGIYSANGVVRRIIDVPVKDAFKQGIIIKSEVLSKEDLLKLNKAVNRNILPQVIKALIYARLFGGSAILLEGGTLKEKDTENLTEAEVNSLLLKTPFSIDDLEQGGNFSITALSLWELNMAGDWQNPKYTEEKAKYDFLTGSYYNVYGNKINKSRLIPLLGDDAPPQKQQQLNGWGFSVLESIVVPLQTYIKQTKVLFEFLDEAKISHLAIPSLQEAMQTESGIANLRSLVGELSQLKNYYNLIVSDKDASFEQKQVNFAWMTQVQEALESDLSSAIGIPKNKLFGDSAGGFASGQDALENYNTMVQYIQTDILPELEKLVYLQAKNLFGNLGESLNLEIDFPPLKVPTEEELGVSSDRKFNKLMQLYDRGIITASQVKDEVNASSSLSLNLPIEEGEEDFPESNFTTQEKNEL